MSTMHRILASILGPVRAERPTAPASAAGAAAAHPLDRVALGSGILTCSPWEGLYVDDEARTV
jgi:hypothetical protein